MKKEKQVFPGLEGWAETEVNPHSRVRRGPGNSPVNTKTFLLALIVRARLAGRNVLPALKIHEEHGRQLCLGGFL